MLDFTLEELCIVACAEAWRGDGEILASPIGLIPTLGAWLAKATFSPDLLLTDGQANVIASVGLSEGPVVEGWMPYRTVFDIVASGRRHVMMGVSQIDRFGNQNISCIGDWQRPSSQLIGSRGAPGNTINHVTSYWVPNHSRRVFVNRVDFVSGVGYDRAAQLGETCSTYCGVRRVITNLAVFDFESDASPEVGAAPHAREMRLRSIHPGVELAKIIEETGFSFAISPNCGVTRAPTADELRLIRVELDPGSRRATSAKAG